MAVCHALKNLGTCSTLEAAEALVKRKGDEAPGSCIQFVSCHPNGKLPPPEQRFIMASLRDRGGDIICMRTYYKFNSCFWGRVALWGSRGSHDIITCLLHVVVVRLRSESLGCFKRQVDQCTLLTQLISPAWHGHDVSSRSQYANLIHI